MNNECDCDHFCSGFRVVKNVEQKMSRDENQCSTSSDSRWMRRHFKALLRASESSSLWLGTFILPHLVHRSIARWHAKRRLWLGLLLCEMCVVMWAVEGEAQSINYLWTHFLKRPVLTRLSFFDRQILVSKENRIARRTNHVKWKRTPKRRRKRSLFIVLNIKKLWPIWEDATGLNNKTAPGYCPAFSRRL